MNFRDSGSSGLNSVQMRKSIDEQPDSSFRDKLNYSTHKPKNGNSINVEY